MSRYTPLELDRIYKHYDNNDFLNSGSSHFSTVPILSNYFTSIKRINLDQTPPVQITWQSFTTDLQSEFSLSSMSKQFKDELYKKYEQLRAKLMLLNESSNNELSLNNSEAMNMSIDDSINNNNSLYNSTKSLNLLAQKLTNNKLLNLNSNNNNSSNYPSKKTANQNTRHASQKSSSITVYLNEKDEPTEQEFDWDDYFDRFHHISTNQNIRLNKETNMSNNNNNVSYAPRNISKSFNNNNGTASNSNSNTDLADSFTLAMSKKKRFDSSLNSYKDNKLSNVVVSSTIGGLSTNSAGISANSNSNYYSIYQDTFILANLNNYTNNLPHSMNAAYINHGSKDDEQLKNYLVWDNNVTSFI